MSEKTKTPFENHVRTLSPALATISTTFGQVSAKPAGIASCEEDLLAFLCNLEGCESHPFCCHSHDFETFLFTREDFKKFSTQDSQSLHAVAEIPADRRVYKKLVFIALAEGFVPQWSHIPTETMWNVLTPLTEEQICELTQNRTVFQKSYIWQRPEPNPETGELETVISKEFYDILPEENLEALSVIFEGEAEILCRWPQDHKTKTKAGETVYLPLYLFECTIKFGMENIIEMML